MSPGQVALFIIGSIVIIVGAYYTTYFLSTKNSKLRSGKTIQLRDRFSLSKDKSFCLVDVKGKTYFLAVTNQGVSVIDTFDVAEFLADEGGEARQAGAYDVVKKGLAGGFAALKNSWSLYRSNPAEKKPNKSKPAGTEDAADINDSDGVYAFDEGVFYDDEPVSIPSRQNEIKEDSLDVVLRKMEKRRVSGSAKDADPREGRG